MRIGLTVDHPLTASNNDPPFSISERINVAQQLKKWLKTGLVLGPFDANYAKRNNITSHMLFGFPKPDGSTRRILNLSDETMFNHSINNLIDPNLCTVEYAQTKQIVETVLALEKKCLVIGKRLKRWILQCIHE